jgi:hypothetical protein
MIYDLDTLFRQDEDSFSAVLMNIHNYVRSLQIARDLDLDALPYPAEKTRGTGMRVEFRYVLSELRRAALKCHW